MKEIVKKIFKLKKVFSSKSRFFLISRLGLNRNEKDEKYLKKLYKYSMNKELNLENPESYNEKLQWLKLHDRKTEYVRMVDKFEAKNFVAEHLGEQYTIPTYGVWDKFDDIDFDKLPNQFVLKCTHDSGGIVICKDKSLLDKESAKKKIDKSLKANYYYMGREWPYKNVPKRIIAEKYMHDDKTEELRDYKFFCFDGKVKAMFIATDRFTKGKETCFDFFDRDFNHLDFKQGHPNAETIPTKPENYELMISLAEKLSSGIPHVRIDFYEVNGAVYFGEITFYHFSGIVPFVPEMWDYKFGSWIDLPKK